MKTILVKDIIGSKSALSPMKGIKLYEFLSGEINDGNQIILSFSGIEDLVTAFSNASFGNLYTAYSIDKIESHLVLKDLNKVWLNKINQAIELATDSEVRDAHNEGMDEVINS
ncbi:MAG: STAS-like domain-containing protein [Fulvivirga sp.]